MSRYGLLGLHLAQRNLTPSTAAALVADLAVGRRGLKSIALDTESLIESGHIRLA